MRPAHIHFFLKAKGFRPLVTQIYDADCQYLENDSVFAVKDSLTVKYKPTTDKNRADVELEVSGCRCRCYVGDLAQAPEVLILLYWISMPSLSCRACAIMSI